MNIGVGINENVFLESAKLDPQTNFFSLGWDFVDSEKPVSVFAALSMADTPDSTATVVNLFPPKVPDKADMTEEKKLKRITDDIGKTKGIFRHIMTRYMKEDDCIINPWENTALTEQNFSQLLMQNAVLLSVHQNMCRQFLKYMQPYIGNKEYPMRLKLVRQSKDKHFATLPGNYLTEQPFLEPMEIPKAESKVVFSKYEIDNGLDNSAPVSKEKAADKPATEVAPTTAASIFGQS